LRLETRARVEVFIPVRQEDPFYQLVAQWVAEEFAVRRGGSTATTAFTGLYVTQSTGHIVRDQVQIIFTDVTVDLEDINVRDELISQLDLFRTDIERLLPAEEEIWVTVSPIWIVRR
jgi:hypothetical protein